MENKPKLWIAGFFFMTVAALGIAGAWTVKVDPFFHFHKPDTAGYYYSLDNQRSQNDGISRNFEYEGLITGTSMTENFKTSQAEEIFGGRFIKVSFSGGSFKEIDNNLKVALRHNENLKTIIRALDMYMFFYDKDYMREDLGNFPVYLYDENPFNDVNYIFNRDVLFSRVYPMTKGNDAPSFQGGITSFDLYSNWMPSYTFGRTVLFPEGAAAQEAAPSAEITQEERDRVRDNIRQNVTALADQYPDVTFYYFFPPYSAAWWQSLLTAGTLNKQLEAERIVIEEILEHPNIRLYSFNCLTDITTDLNHYKDSVHYGEWINSLMLKYMWEGECLLSWDNYEEYLEREEQFYTTYDYTQINYQEDYENDYYAAALLNEKIYGVSPFSFDLAHDLPLEKSGAEILEDQHGGRAGVVCQGSLQRNPGSEIPVSEYLRDTEYMGVRCEGIDVSPYKYLSFYGKKLSDHGQPSVYIYDETGSVVGEYSLSYHNLDGEWHQYLMDVSQINGEVTIIFHGGYVDSTGSPDSKYVFGEIALY